MVVEGAVSSNAKLRQSNVPLIFYERSDFYPWNNGTNLVFKRGPALIFNHPTHSHMAEKFEVALKHLEYSPTLLKLSEAEATLKNSNFKPFSHKTFLIILLVSLCGLMSNEGSLFVVVIGTIEGFEERNSTGLTVALGGDTPIPIGHLTTNFITSNCATLAEKPKVFIFIDPGVATNYMDKGVPVSTFF
jgi:hypothetical protein